jgi:outer membrane protein TolC
MGVMLELPLPLFDANQASVDAALAEARRSRSRTAEAELRALAEYRGLRESLAALRSARDALRDGVVAPRQSDLDLARAAFAAGRTDRTPVLRAEMDLAEARIELVTAELAMAEKVLDGGALLGEWEVMR